MAQRAWPKWATWQRDHRGPALQKLPSSMQVRVKMSAYLTADELADLIGCKPNQRSVMATWLKAWLLTAWTAGNGWG